ncbi:MAG: pentapeptide repeat-containing protein [Nostocaceae cyanobacterium]|nr:pentapeptide repeat-containing protein [Nostocaceae cyanobacterium]
MDKEKKISSENINHSQPANGKQTTGKKSKILKPIAIVDTKLSDLVDWLQTISLFKLAVILSEGAILLAVVSYIVTIPNRRREEIQQARNVLHEESSNEYSDGRIAALKVLNKHCQGNPGFKAPDGKMSELRLEVCRDFSFENGLLKVKKRAMNLSNSNLKGANLSGADLQGINLRGSDLRNANLAGANLEGADLTDAKLQGANLSRANFKGAILKGAFLEGAIVEKGELKNSNLYGANFQYADFSKANLKGIRALWANFNHANFYGANLQSANFNRAQLMGADFYKANLEKAKLRFADLSSNTNSQGEQFTGANLREAQLKGADLWGTKFWSAFQLKRAKNSEQSRLMPNWEQQIRQPRPPRLRIALLKPEPQQSIFEAYELGMRRAANRRVEIWAIPYGYGVEDEAKAIKELVKKGIDGIILTPEDPIKSKDALMHASDAGVAITTVDFCFEPSEAEDLAIACYDTDKFQMGYDSGEYLAKWAKKHILPNSPSKEKIVEVALVDGAIYERYYPYLQGVLKSINAHPRIKIKDSVGVASRKDIIKVKQLLKDKDNSQVQILWGGSNLATEVAIKAVTELELENKVKVFGILDLSMEKAKRLLDDKSPLQLIIDQSGHLVGYKAVKRTIDVLRGKHSGADYNCITIKHRPLTEDSLNIKEVEELITKSQTFENQGKNRGFSHCKSVSKHH